MTHDELVRQKVSEWHPAAGRQDLVLSLGQTGWTLNLTADRKDELGCLIREMTLSHTGGTAVPAVALPGLTLSTWAERIAQRVTGLLEPLKVVEIDSERTEGLLRSDAPLSRGDKVFYYEVLLKGTTSARMCRYQATHDGSKREQVAFALTQEALAKLVGDVTAEK